MRRAVVSSFATLDYVMTTTAPDVARGTNPARVVAEAWPRAGGAAYYAARALAAHGHQCDVLVGIGDDAAGAVYRQACQAAGLAAEGIAMQPSGRSATCLLVYHADGGHSCLLDAGAPPPFALSFDQAALVDKADLVVLAAAPADITRAIVARLTPKHAVAWIVKDDSMCFPAALRDVLATRADFVFCNAAERHLLPDGSSPRLAPQWVIETRGAEGVWVQNQTVRMRVPVTRVETDDATGAGDTLAGSVLAHWLSGEPDINLAVEHAILQVQTMLLGRTAR